MTKYLYYCSECGEPEESLDDFTNTACGLWLCDRCLEKHEAKYPQEEK